MLELQISQETAESVPANSSYPMIALQNQSVWNRPTRDKHRGKDMLAQMIEKGGGGQWKAFLSSKMTMALIWVLGGRLYIGGRQQNACYFSIAKNSVVICGILPP